MGSATVRRSVSPVVDEANELLADITADDIRAR
jgi:hypothetical protein